MTKEETIEEIVTIISRTHRNNKSIDWARLSAYKIYDIFNPKPELEEELPMPQSFEKKNLE